MSTTTTTPYQAGDHVQIQRKGQLIHGRVAAVRHGDRAVAYVINTSDGVLSIWTTSGHCSFLRRAGAGQ